MDKNLVAALTKAYVARAKLFHTGVKASKIDLLIAEIDSIDGSRLNWTEKEHGVSIRALELLKQSGGTPHQVFAHPDVVRDRPHLICYYRNIIAISKKGIDQILFSTDVYESGRKETVSESDARRICQTFNRILSAVIEELPDYSVRLSRQAFLAEIGDFTLNSGWRIAFASEPDVAFFDADGTKQIAIEIKGSLDVAGAQSRYGEAKKSFAKQLDENPRCHTVYLASCFTDAVIEQIKRDGQVREWFNLTSILYDESEKNRFLNRVFHIVRTPL